MQNLRSPTPGSWWPVCFDYFQNVDLHFSSPQTKVFGCYFFCVETRWKRRSIGKRGASKQFHRVFHCFFFKLELVNMTIIMAGFFHAKTVPIFFSWNFQTYKKIYPQFLQLGLGFYIWELHLHVPIRRKPRKKCRKHQKRADTLGLCGRFILAKILSGYIRKREAWTCV